MFCHPRMFLSGIHELDSPGKPGEIKVTAEMKGVIARSHAEGGATRQSVIITISDNGSGILADKLKDVCRPFHTTKAEGPGLGLYITKQLVEKIRGRINVESESGKGTTFTVCLPA